MNSKTPNSSSRKSFSREELNEFLKNPSYHFKHEIDEFETDALQGWKKASGGIELMESIDQQFNYLFKPNFLLFSILSMLFLFAFIGFYQTNKTTISTNQKNQIKTNVPITVDTIDELVELPEQKQIHARQLVHRFKNQKKNPVSIVNPTIYVDENEVFVLPIKKINPSSSLPIVKLEKKTAKEIYAFDLKIIDYRSYRSRPVITGDKRVLTGTSADRENASFTTANSDWKPLEIPYHQYISETMEVFQAGNYRQTLNRTKSILTFYPDDINALFYGGLCYYNLNEMNAAIDAFKKVLENRFQNFDEEAAWYLANAYLANQDRINGKATLEWIVEQHGFYAKQAEKALKKIN